MISIKKLIKSDISTDVLLIWATILAFIVANGTLICLNELYILGDLNYMY